jgi:hypothetical protein
VEYLIVGLIVQIIIVAVWSFLHAYILQGRAKKKQNWDLPYRHAYMVSIKANLLAAAAGTGVALALLFSVGAGEKVINAVNLLVTLPVWWFAHSQFLLSTPTAPNLMQPKQARQISTAVFAAFILVAIVIGIVGVVSALAIPMFIGIGK